MTNDNCVEPNTDRSKEEITSNMICAIGLSTRSQSKCQIGIISSSKTSKKGLENANPIRQKVISEWLVVWQDMN